MGKRNMEEIARITHITILQNKDLSRYGMSFDEYCRLLDSCHKGQAAEAVSIAFAFGFAMGSRAQTKHKITVL